MTAENVTPLNEDTRALRQPPQNTEVEQALLGAVLRKNEAYDACGALEAHHFYAPEHQRLWAMIAETIEKGRPANTATLAHTVDSDELLQGVGGSDYLHQLDASLVTIINARHYAETITDLYHRREAIGAAEDALARLWSGDVDDTASDVCASLMDSLADVTAEKDDAGVVSLSDAVARQIGRYEEAHKDVDATIGLTTGLADLDAKIGGFEDGKLYVVAGRPSMGKSLVAFDFARRVAGESWSLLISREMGDDQIADRAIAYAARINTMAARRGDLTAEDWDRIERARMRLTDAQVLIDERARTVAAIDRLVRQQKRKRALGAVFIDYLQLLQASSDARRKGSDVAEISEITQQLKELARRHDLPVILLSQLNRDVEKREDKRPQLADLRSSGSIEQDADTVIFLYRPEYYLEKEYPEQRANESSEKFRDRQDRHKQLLAESRNVLELIVGKQRSGPEGIVELYCDLPRMTIDDLKRDEGLFNG